MMLELFDRFAGFVVPTENVDMVGMGNSIAMHVQSILCEDRRRRTYSAALRRPFW
jgi:hypothetical protein